MAASSTPSPNAASEASDPADFQALQLAVTPSVYANNAFRVIGIPIDVTAREIAKRMAEKKLRAELGDTSSAKDALFSEDSSPSIDRQRDAEQELRDPAVRLIHELFWFWPMDSRGCAHDPALHALASGDASTAEKLWRAMESNPQTGPIAAHNIAVRWHIAALQRESKWSTQPGDEKSREVLTRYWHSSMKRWSRLQSDNAFWHFLAARVVALDDPRVSLTHVAAIRRQLPTALAGINAEFCVRHAGTGDFDLVTMHIRLVRDAYRFFEDPDTFGRLVLTRVKDVIRRRAETAKKALAESPITAIDSSKDLAQCLNRYVRLFGMLNLVEDPQVRDVVDEGVKVALDCAVISNKHTDDDATFVDVVGELTSLPTGEAVKERAVKNLESGKAGLLNRQLNPVYVALTAVRESTDPPDVRLQAFVKTVSPLLAQALDLLPVSEPARAALIDTAAFTLRNISVDAWNTGKNGKTALGALNRALALGGSETAKKALYDDFHTLQKLVADTKSAQRKKQVKVVGWTAAAIAFFVWFSIVINDPAAPANAPSPSANTSSRPGNVAPRPSGGSSLADQSQPTYRVPARDVPQLESESANIDQQKAIEKRLDALLSASEKTLAEEQERADAFDVEVDAMKNQLDRAQASVDHSDSLSIASFNARVDQYNALVRESRAQRRKANALVGPHNDLVAKVNAQQRVVNQMIDAYNAHLERVGH